MRLILAIMENILQIRLMAPIHNPCKSCADLGLKTNTSSHRVVRGPEHWHGRNHRVSDDAQRGKLSEFIEIVFGFFAQKVPMLRTAGPSEGHWLGISNSQ